jgi:hypothetical protein
MVVWGEAWAVGGLPTAEGAAPVTSAPAGPTTEDGRLEILNGDSTVRVCIGLKTPVYATADGQIKTVTFGNKPVAEIDYLPAAGNWMQPDFDDMAWGRERLPLEIPRPWPRDISSAFGPGSGWTTPLKPRT